MAPVQHVPNGESQTVASMQPFGEQYQKFGFSAQGSTLELDPPANYDHLWGGFLQGMHCATKVDFEMVLVGTPKLPNFGLAVAPRANLLEGQPQGASIQYEYETTEINPHPGSYIRPTALPGGAWSVAVKPVTAPNVRLRHHVRVYAEGTTMTIDIDGRQIAQYELPTAECGGVAVRVWGAAFKLSAVKIHGT